MRALMVQEVSCVQGKAELTRLSTRTRPNTIPSTKLLGNRSSVQLHQRHPHTLAAVASPVDTSGVATGGEEAADEGVIDWRQRWSATPSLCPIAAFFIGDTHLTMRFVS
jgi:hypothetical protein